MNNNEWIIDWDKIEDNLKYIVCPINFSEEFYLGQPIGIMKGWEVTRLTEKCYAAVIMPKFTFKGY